MERQSIPPAENKLLLLYIISRMGAMDDQSLERFVLENGLMGYMEARLALAELLEAGLLQALDDQPPRVYLITGDGTKTLELFQTKLPYSRRNKVEELCAAWRAKLRREKQVLAQYRPHPGGCTVRLFLLEESMRLLDISLDLPDVESARKLCEDWEKNTAQLYTAVLQALRVGSA